MSLTTLLPWFGAKGRLAPTIVSELGHHTSYFEPFCGSCAVLLRKPPCSAELINDLHSDLVNMAVILASPDWTEFASRLERTLFCEGLHRYAVGQLEQSAEFEVPDLDRAIWFFLAEWQTLYGFGGTDRGGKTTRSFSIRYKSTGGQSPHRYQAAVNSLASWHQRLANVTITNRDGFELLERIPDEPGTVVYLDPPYLSETRSRARYQHDFSDTDHTKLASLLARFQQARVVVSYYQHNRLQALYPGWTVRECDVRRNTSAGTRGGELDVAREALLINGQSFIKTPVTLF